MGGDLAPARVAVPTMHGEADHMIHPCCSCRPRPCTGYWFVTCDLSFKLIELSVLSEEFLCVHGRVSEDHIRRMGIDSFKRPAREVPTGSGHGHLPARPPGGRVGLADGFAFD